MKGAGSGIFPGRPLLFIWLISQREIVAALGRGTVSAEDASVSGNDLAVVVDSFAADGAGDARGFVAGHLARVDRDLDPLFREEVLIRELAVGEHLLLVLVFDVGIEGSGLFFG